MKNSIYSAGLALSISFALAACGSTSIPKPGQYEQSMKLTSFEVTGVPQAQADAMKKQVEANPMPSETMCVGSAGKDDWKQAAAEIDKQLGGDCTTLKNEGNETSIATELSCKGTVMGDVDLKLNVKAEAESYGGEVVYDMKIPGSPAKIHMTAQMTAKRIGDCKG